MDDLWRRKGWSGLSLARQFALAGGVVMLVATGLVGWFVAGRIEEVVVRNTANATALYMESFVAPLTKILAMLIICRTKVVPGSVRFWKAQHLVAALSVSRSGVRAAFWPMRRTPIWWAAPFRRRRI